MDPRVILGRSFMRLVNGIVDFSRRVITVYPEQDMFEDDSKKIEKSMDDWDQLLDFNFDDIPQLDGGELQPFVCKMGKSSRNKKRAMKNLNLFYPDIRPSLSAGRHLTQKEAAKEALALRISQKFALLEEVRPVLETMAYNDKYKKVLNEIWKDKVGVTTIIAKFLILDIPIDRDASIVVGQGFLYTIGGMVNTPKSLFLNFDGICHQTFHATRSDVLITVESDIGDEEEYEIKINKFRAPISDVLRTAKSESDNEEEYEIKRNKFGAPMYGLKPASYLNCNDPAERSLALQTVINPFRKINVWKKATMGGNDDEAESSRPKRSRQFETVEEVLLTQVHHEFLLWEGCSKEAKSRYNTKLAHLLPRHVYSPCVVNWDILNRMGCDGEIDEMLRIKLREAGSNEEIFTFVAWIRAFNINEPVYSKLCHEFYSTYEFDEVCVDDELQTKKIIKFRLGGRAHSLTLLEFARRLGLYHADELNEEGFDVYFQGGMRILRVVHRMITYVSCQRTTRDLDTTSLRELIDSEGRLIPEDPQSGVLRVTIPRPSRASMQDFYDRMGSMEIRYEAIERMEYKQSYHWDRYARVFEHVVGVYSVPLQGAYNSPGYAQPQIMDPTSSLGRIFLGENVYGSSSEKTKGHGDWNAPEYTDTTGSKEKKVTKELSFYKMETDEEDDVEPGVIFGRSFMRLVNGIVDFGSRVITIYPEKDPFEDDSEKIEKNIRTSSSTGRHLTQEEAAKEALAIRISQKFTLLGAEPCQVELAWLIEPMGNLNLFYPDIRTSSSTGRHLTQEEAAKEALAHRISQKFALLEEVRPVLETMTYNDKYKKVLDEI
ncbi:hypothetical protein Tco_1176570 [Tanacetum coccineum]